MTTVKAPICMTCDHFIDDPERLICEAFPNGIPEAIINSQADHRMPYPGDNGIQYKRKLNGPGLAEPQYFNP
ncbi:hypothetical protein Tfer_2615 [Thermincola ferriacetica]|uniref:Uncharacterized protein n=1 Tax=Thermincola ferriacetica TaxID=281456 RepID=A0A0L6W048_9FIRM|nr:hypothetical protein [Thermincola ferriacetica]KNZ68846.1 hypothetical protein Tfer_2615 [Thermincola ferriacetica]